MKETKIEKLILDLSTRWDCSPQEAVDRLNSMNESEINKLINSMTKKFKNGGMIDCLRSGGKTYAECKKCGGNLVRKGATGFDTDEVVPNLSRYKFYGRDWYTNNDGSSYSVETVATKRDDLPANWNTNPEAQQNMGEFDPDIMQRFIDGDTTIFRGGYYVPRGTADWKRSNAVIDSLGVRAGVKKAQDGTTLTRRDAIDTLRNKGFSRSQARLAYQNQKNALRNNGFSGDEMRQAARRNIVGQPTTVSRLIPVSRASINTGTPQTYSPEAMSTRQEDNYMRLMTQRARAMANAEAATNFGDAFSIARNAGLQNFRWNGRDFNTRTSDEQNLIDSVLAKIAPQSKGFILPDVPAYKPYLPDVVAPVLENVKEEPLPQLPPYDAIGDERIYWDPNSRSDYDIYARYYE